ncbi:MAG: hypothetical protein ACE5IO_07595 [Thermoplasmata archaeon]
MVRRTRCIQIVRGVAGTFKACFYDGPIGIGAKVCIGDEKARTERILVCSDDTIASESYWSRVQAVID